MATALHACGLRHAISVTGFYISHKNVGFVTVMLPTKYMAQGEHIACLVGRCSIYLLGGKRLASGVGLECAVGIKRCRARELFRRCLVTRVWLIANCLAQLYFEFGEVELFEITR